MITKKSAQERVNAGQKGIKEGK
ncbi:hypothetical protein PSPO01_00111 [Paraphaeosphaeria sporulosa]